MLVDDYPADETESRCKLERAANTVCFFAIAADHHCLGHD
jgi:hypothetical protein